MTDTAAVTLAADIRTLSGSLDCDQWAIAERTAQAKAERVDRWAEVVGRVAGRSPRTVRGWASVAEFRQSLGASAPAMKFAYYAEALRYADKLPIADIISLMLVARDEDASADQYAAELRDMAGTPEPDYAKQLLTMQTALLGLVDSYTEPATLYLRVAARALGRAANEVRKVAV